MKTAQEIKRLKRRVAEYQETIDKKNKELEKQERVIYLLRSEVSLLKTKIESLKSEIGSLENDKIQLRNLWNAEEKRTDTYARGLELIIDIFSMMNDNGTFDELKADIKDHLLINDK